MGVSREGGERAIRHLKGGDFRAEADSHRGDASRSRGDGAYTSETIGHSPRHHGGQGSPIGGLLGETPDKAVHLGLDRAEGNGRGTEVLTLKKAGSHTGAKLWITIAPFLDFYQKKLLGLYFDIFKEIR
jgi:hypothetical protein